MPVSAISPAPVPTPFHDSTLADESTALRPAGAGALIRVPEDYPTLSAALDAARSGDTVRVAAGTYAASELSVPAGVQLIGDGWQNTIIDGAGAAVVLYAADRTLIQGFTIRGSGPDYFHSAVWVSEGTVTLRDNRVTGNAAGIWAWCFDLATCNIRVELERNIIDRNALNAVNSNEVAVFVLRNNVIFGNGGSGIILNDADSLAENNLVGNNGSIGIANNAGAVVRYNSAWANAHGNFTAPPSSGAPLDPTNVQVDALFRDADNADFRLRAGSPVIGAGTPIGSDMGPFPFSSVGDPPLAVSFERVNCAEWEVRWVGSASGFTLYYGPANRRTTTIRELGAVNTIRLGGLNEANWGYVAVSARDASGQESAVRLPSTPPVGCPEAPSELIVGAFPGSITRLRWTDHSSVEQAYEVERAQSAMPPSAFERIAVLPANTTTFQDAPPTREATYWYRVRAVNAAGASQYSNVTYNALFHTAPNLDEMYLLVLINEARASPATYGLSGIAPMAPLAYNPLLNYAARSHSQAILNSGFQIGHVDLVGRGPSDRAYAVGYDGGVGENLIAGMTGPEWVESSNRAFLNSAGHRDNRLCPCFNEAGLGHTYDPAKGEPNGWKGQYTETFSGRPGVRIPILPSGIAVPYHGGPGTEFTYIVNYYHPDGLGPTQASVIIDGVAHAMRLSSGAPANGTYRLKRVLEVGETNRYTFEFHYPGGIATLDPLGGESPSPTPSPTPTPPPQPGPFAVHVPMVRNQ